MSCSTPLGHALWVADFTPLNAEIGVFAVKFGLQINNSHGRAGPK